MQRSLRIVLVVSLICAALASHAYRLAFKDTAGATRTYNNAINLTGSVQAMGLNVPVTGTVNFVMSETVNSVTTGSANITTQIQNGMANVTLSGLPGDEGAQTINEPIPPITITYDRTPLGAISNVKVTGQQAVLPGLPSELLTNLQTPGQGIAFPNRDIAAGESWTGQQNLQLGQGGSAAVSITNKLVGPLTMGGRNLIQIDSTMTANVANLTVNMGDPGQSAAIPVNVKLNGTGTTLFDPQAGVIYSMKSQYTVNATVSGLGDAGTITMNLTLNGTTTLQ